MATVDPSHHHEPPFTGFDHTMEHVLGADVRLLYGFAAPILMVVGLIVVLALNPTGWLVAAILVVEALLLVVVVTGIVGLMGEDETDEDIL